MFHGGGILINFFLSFWQYVFNTFIRSGIFTYLFIENWSLGPEQLLGRCLILLTFSLILIILFLHWAGALEPEHGWFHLNCKRTQCRWVTESMWIASCNFVRASAVFFLVHQFCIIFQSILHNSYLPWGSGMGWMYLTYDSPFCRLAPQL